jgi:hypothetical protein
MGQAKDAAMARNAIVDACDYRSSLPRHDLSTAKINDKNRLSEAVAASGTRTVQLK